MPRALTVEQTHQTPLGEAGCVAEVCEHHQEMQRLRRNLHDGLGPVLAGIMLRTDILSTLVATDRGRAEAVLRELRHDAAAFLTEFRRVVSGQPPAELDGRDLGDALRVLAARLSGATGGALAITVDDGLADIPLGRDVEVAALWIVKEALTNVVKHARATTCAIRVRASGATLRVSIVDNGIGGVRLGRRGVGLTSMGHRAAEVGGWCEIADNPAPGTGATVSACLPAGPGECATRGEAGTG